MPICSITTLQAAPPCKKQGIPSQVYRDPDEVQPAAALGGVSLCCMHRQKGQTDDLVEEITSTWSASEEETSGLCSS